MVDFLKGKVALIRDLIGRLIVWLITKPLPSPLKILPDRYGLTYEEIVFPSAHQDSVLLSGWLIPAEDPKGLIILCHGINSTRVWMLDKARFLRELGYTTFLFDFRSRGRSQGDRCTLGIRERDDILGALNFLSQHAHTRELPKGAIGESLGAASLLRALKLDNTIRAATLEACFTSLGEAIDRRCGWLPWGWGPSCSRWLQSLLLEEVGIDCSKVSPLSDVKAIGERPLLFIHDSWDIWCPKNNAEQLFIEAPEPKELWVAPYTPHVCAAWAAQRGYQARVGDFFNRHLQEQFSSEMV